MVTIGLAAVAPRRKFAAAVKGPWRQPCFAATRPIVGASLVSLTFLAAESWIHDPAPSGR